MRKAFFSNMNRLVIIGNGFDRAHNLPTLYSHFIDDLWIEIVENSESHQGLVYLDNRTYDITPIKKDCNFKKLVENIEFYCEHSRKKYSQLTWNIKDLHFYAINLDSIEIKEILYFNNDFFKTITSEHIENWVDIENLYYKELKKIVKDKGNDHTKSEDFWIKERKRKVKKLNDEFDSIKILFEKYLKEKVFNIFNFSEYPDLLSNQLKFPNKIKPISFIEESKEMELFLNEFPSSFKDGIKNQFVYRGDELIKDCKVTFLSFNYTPTIDNYISILNHWGIETEIIHIHGFVGDLNNKINFGFGDEMDDDYKMIENINDNEYLRNFKSFQYLHTSNYKRLLNLIDSNHFQVYIMGHSCGLSDRTLLNTIFEHGYCLSIKIFYHEIKDEDDNLIKDNYTEITQNISRHFDDKKLMREKIVNKTLCQPLPQIQLPKKE